MVCVSVIVCHFQPISYILYFLLNEWSLFVAPKKEEYVLCARNTFLFIFRQGHHAICFGQLCFVLFFVLI